MNNVFNLMLFFLMTNGAFAQLIQMDFENDLSTNSGQFSPSLILGSGISYPAGIKGMSILFEDSTALAFPQELTDSIKESSFEVLLSFKLALDTTPKYPSQQIISQKGGKPKAYAGWYLRFSEWGNFRNLQLVLSDGSLFKAYDFGDAVEQNIWYKLSLSYKASEGVMYVQVFKDSKEIIYSEANFIADGLDTLALHNAINSEPIHIGWTTGQVGGDQLGPLYIDEFKFYTPSKPDDIDDLKGSLLALIDHFNGDGVLSEEDLSLHLSNGYLAVRNQLLSLKSEILDCLAAFENNNPPLFSNYNRVSRNTLTLEEQFILSSQEKIHDNLFTSALIEQAIGINFKAREAYPGAVNSGALRKADTTVTVSGSYTADWFIDWDFEFSMRPLGHYAEAGEAVTMEYIGHPQT